MNSVENTETKKKFREWERKFVYLNAMMIYEQTPSSRVAQEKIKEIEMSRDDGAYLIYIFSNLTHVSGFFFHLKFSYYFLWKHVKKVNEIFLITLGVYRKDSTDFDSFPIKRLWGAKNIRDIFLIFNLREIKNVFIIIRPRQFSPSNVGNRIPRSKNTK